MDRRAFLINISTMLGCSITALDVAAIESALSFSSNSPSKLMATQINIIATIADIIIPQTDTPSASQAGVHLYVDFYLHEFLSATKRDKFLLELAGLYEPFPAFLSLQKSEQLAVVQALDDQLNSENESPTYKKLKQLVFIGYYTSEVGATQALKYDPVPGPYKEMKLKDVGGVWF